LPGCLWHRDRDQFDLVELVLTQHATRVPAGSAGLGAETRRQSRETEREHVLVEDPIADEIGQRHFRRRYEPELLFGRGSLQQFLDQSTDADLSVADALA